jgi:hypothetical protein
VRNAVQLVLNIPDDFIDPVKEKLAAGSTGILEAVAIDAILKYLMILDSKTSSSP